MSRLPLSREDAQAALDAYNDAGRNFQAAADKTGLSRSTIQARVRRAVAYGLDDGVVQEAMPGRYIKGVSTLYDGDGNVRAQWVKEFAEADDVAVLSEQLIDVFAEYKGAAKLKPGPSKADRDLLTVYPISDHHLGLYAWCEETGDDYDLDIGSRLLRETMGQLVASSPDAKEALILVLGDFFHSDTSKNQTANSGNALDVDTRYAKVIRTGVELLIECIELALQKHKKVRVKILPGNHDEHSAICLAIALQLFFKGSRRVLVDSSPARVWAHQHGKCMIASTHGDMVKMKDLAGVMASVWPEMWGATKFRYGYTGHIHHNSKIEQGGAIVESFQTLSAKDAWHFNSGYVSGRSMVSITLHVEKGEYARCTVSL